MRRLVSPGDLGRPRQAAIVGERLGALFSQTNESGRRLDSGNVDQGSIVMEV